MPSGGKRPGAGRPRKPLSTRIEEGIGVVSHAKPKVLAYPEKSKTEKSNNQNSKPEPPPEFLNMSSKEGGSNIPSAAEIYAATLEWVTDAGCERFVSKQLIEDFAFTRRSYLEAEFMNKQMGRVMKGGKPSPYVKTALEYLKVTTGLYREIQNIIAQNCTAEYSGGAKPNAFIQLLQSRDF